MAEKRVSVRLAEVANATPQAQDLGAVFDEGAIAAMRRTEVALLGVSLVFEGLRNRIGVAMAPGIERLANAVVGLASEGGALRGAIDALIRSSGTVGGNREFWPSRSTTSG